MASKLSNLACSLPATHPGNLPPGIHPQNTYRADVPNPGDRGVNNDRHEGQASPREGANTHDTPEPVFTNNSGFLCYSIAPALGVRGGGTVAAKIYHRRHPRLYVQKWLERGDGYLKPSTCTINKKLFFLPLLGEDARLLK